MRILSLLAVVALGLAEARLEATPPTLEGNCPVCLVDNGHKVAGSDKHTIVIDRQAYSFRDAKHLEKFKKNPQRYLPALAGDCPVCLKHHRRRTAGKIDYGMKYNKRLYLFANPEHQKQFLEHPERYASIDLGLDGHCPVSILEAHSWSPGNAAWESIYDGFRYRFATAEAKNKFDADPGRYVPALGGNCVVCMQDAGKLVPGSPYYAATFNGRTYLFPNESIRNTFNANYANYTFSDLANHGFCPVCSRQGGRTAGAKEYLSVYKGKLYMFPSEEHRNRFDADPAQFATPLIPTQMSASAASKLTYVTGKSGCAYCEFRVRPRTEPDSLGMSVITKDKIYVLEGAEKMNPELFDERYDGLPVEVLGQITHTEGRFVWIQPVLVRELD